MRFQRDTKTPWLKNALLFLKLIIAQFNLKLIMEEPNQGTKEVKMGLGDRCSLEAIVNYLPVKWEDHPSRVSDLTQITILTSKFQTKH